MGTRCQIAIHYTPESTDWTYLFHHYDGYPDRVGVELVEFLKTFSEEWTPDRLQDYINNRDESYHYSDGPIRWDSEYVYVITCSTHQLKCYYKGITDPNRDEFDLKCPGDPLEIEGNVFSEPTVEKSSEREPSKYDGTDWTSYRLELVKYIIQGLVSHPTYMMNISRRIIDETGSDDESTNQKIVHSVADNAIDIADGIIRRLKEDK